MPNTISPNMSLILPTVGQEPGPNWALDLNSSLSLVDQHNHAPGSGVQITPAGMDINIDLPFNGNNAISLKSIRFSSQVAPLAGGSDIGCLYVSGANLYYNDTLGNQIQMTAGGAVNGTPRSIGNLVAPAAVNYVPANQTFVFQSNQTNNTPATLDVGNVLIRNLVPSGNYIQIQPNPVLPASYSLTLLSALPASTQLLSITSSGQLQAVSSLSSVNPTFGNLQVTNINTSGLITAVAPVGNAIALRLAGRSTDNASVLDFTSNNQITQYAIITATTGGLTLNLPDVADSYTFQVNGATKATINNSGIDGQYLYNIPASALPAVKTGVVSLPNLNNLGGGLYNLGNVSIITSSANSVILANILGAASNSYFSDGTAGVGGTGYGYVTLTGPGGYSVTLYFDTLGSSTGNSLSFLTTSVGTYTATIYLYTTSGFGRVTSCQLRITEIR